MSSNSVGRISYLNTEPFFFAWDSKSFPFINAAPRALAECARRGEIIAGPLPVAECWSLEDRFEPLDNWGIAVHADCESVLVQSRVPFNELGGHPIGLTNDSSTSVALLRVLSAGVNPKMPQLRRGYFSDDVGRLIIGDQALAVSPTADWPYVVDLAAEWRRQTGRPFVFAQWVMDRSLRASVKSKLSRTLAESTAWGQENIRIISEKMATAKWGSADRLERYLRNFIYKLSAPELEAIREFRNRVQLLDKNKERVRTSWQVV